jgi:AraC-like DNA-binding protein
VSRLTDRTVALDELLPGAAVLEAGVLATAAFDARIVAATAFLRGALPPRDPVVDHVAAVVQRILDDRAIRRVDDVVRLVGGTPRALQRLFSEYVGVSPKWVIRRYRLHDAIERMDAGDVVDWASLALDLGYFDQAHFIRDFKALVGRTPGDYGLGGSRLAPRAARRLTR